MIQPILIGGLLTLLVFQPLNLLAKEPIGEIYPVSLVTNVNRSVEVGGEALEQSADQIEEHRIEIVEMVHQEVNYPKETR